MVEMNKLDGELAGEIERLKEGGLYRSLRSITGVQGPRVEIDGEDYLCFCSNNYLGLAAHPAVRRTAADAASRFGWGAGASRLVSGTMELHGALEREIAAFKGTESAILFPTGYMANLGVITALTGASDTVITDRLNHASIIDGCRLSGARLRVYPHRNAEALQRILSQSGGAKRRLVVTESIFSMDGDLAPLEEIARLSEEYGASLMVDEAHATGILGEFGRGGAELAGVEEGVDISMGTLSKALGGMGGFVAGSAVLIDYLRNRARSFIYTTSPPPAACAAAIAAIGIVRGEPRMREALLRNAGILRRRLDEIGLNTMESAHHIVPVLIGDAARAVEASGMLYRRKILVPAIRPPTVPRNMSRLRIAVMATHTDEDIAALTGAFEEVALELPEIPGERR